jgi:hypothetical protein
MLQRPGGGASVGCPRDLWGGLLDKNVAVLPVLLGGLGQLQRAAGSGFSARLQRQLPLPSTTPAINCRSHFVGSFFLPTAGH